MVATLEDLRRRHELSPLDVASAEAVADAHRRRNEPALARAALQRCLCTRQREGLAGAPALIAGLVALAPPPPPQWQVLHRLPIDAAPFAAPLDTPAPPRIVGSCLLGADWQASAFGGRALGGGAAAHPVTVLVALTDGRLWMVDVASGEHSALGRVASSGGARRSHPPQLRQYDIRVDALAQSVAWRDPPGPFAALWPGQEAPHGAAHAAPHPAPHRAAHAAPHPAPHGAAHAAPHMIDGRTCVTPSLQPDRAQAWLMGGLHGDIAVLSRQGEQVLESRWSLGRSDPIWAIGCGADGAVTTIHDWTGLEVRSAVGGDELVHALEDAALMHGRVRVSSDGARAGSLLPAGRRSGEATSGAALLRIYSWREARWSEVEVELAGLEGWSSDALLQRAVAWSRTGELCWLDLVSGDSLALPTLHSAPMRVWPSPDGHFAVALHVDRIDILG